MNNINFKLAGLTCEACLKLVSRKLKKIPGVTSVKVDLASGETQVTSSGKIDLEILRKSLENTHYSIVK